MSKFIGFDIEVARWQPPYCDTCRSDATVSEQDGGVLMCEKCGKSGQSYEFINKTPPGEYGLGVICAAASWRNSHGEIRDRVWAFGDEMNSAEVNEIVLFLAEMFDVEDYIPVSFNGLQFDFNVLAHESGSFGECKRLALQHVDLMAMLNAINGWHVGLDSLARGMGFAGKLHEVNGVAVSGKDAPLLWKAGKRDEVLAYQVEDARQTLLVAEACQEKKRMSFYAKSGRLYNKSVPGLQTVQWCIDHPYKGDTSWMSSFRPVREWARWAL